MKKLKSSFSLVALLLLVLFARELPASAAEASASLLKSLPGMTGEVAWPSGKAQWIVLDFWASWCGPCHEAAPFLEQQKKTWKDKNILWIGINEDSDLEEGRKFLRNHPSSFLELQDLDKKLAHSLEIDTLPRLFVLDSNFHILWSERGFTPSKRRKIEEQLKILFQKP